MKNYIIQRRIYILIALVIMLPLLFNFYSQVLMVWGVRNGIITASLIVVVVWFILSLFMGRSASCGYACPYGALQEIFGHHILKKKPKSKKSDKLKYIVFIFFIVVASFSLFMIGGFNEIDIFAPEGNLKLIMASIFVMLIGAISLLFGSRAYCRYLCPIGVLFTIGAKLGRNIKIPSLHLISQENNCSNCKLCDKACPIGLDVSNMVKYNAMDDPNCILCGECIKKCPKDAINYSFGIKK